MALKDYAMYRDFKVLKRMVREDVIRIMPKAHKFPDALYLKEHLGAVVHYMAAASITRDPQEKASIADSMLFELFVIRDEIEEQQEAFEKQLPKSLKRAMQSVNSYLGYFRQYRTYSLREKLAQKCFKKYGKKIYFGKSYLKMIIKKKPKKRKKKGLQAIYQKDA